METENLLAMLFGQMNEQQQLRFKQAIVAQTVFYVSQRLPVAEIGGSVVLLGWQMRGWRNLLLKMLNELERR
jgi:hypothetical protein